MKRPNKYNAKKVRACPKCWASAYTGTHGRPVPTCGCCGSAKDLITFDSKAEHKRGCELKGMEKRGEITGLERQPKFLLTCGGKDILVKSERYKNGRRATYAADFRYRIVIDGILQSTDPELAKSWIVVEDVKAARKATDTEASRLRRAIVEAEYGITIEVIKA